MSNKLIPDTKKRHFHQYRMPHPGERYLECEFCGAQMIFGREINSIRQVDQYRQRYKAFPEYRKQFRLAFLSAWQYYKRPDDFAWRSTLDRAIAAGAFPPDFVSAIDEGVAASAEYWFNKAFPNVQRG